MSDVEPETSTLSVTSRRHLATTRATVAAAAAAHLGEGRFDDVALAVSELVTNALEHGYGDVAIDHGPCGSACYQVSVASTSPSSPRRSPEPVPPEDFAGRGLNIVAALAEDLTMLTVDGLVTVRCRFGPE